MAKNKLGISLLVILGLVIFVNIVGLIIELLFKFNVLQTDLANIRDLNVFSILFSLIFIVVGIIFWFKFYKRNKNLVRWWNIFMVSWFALVRLVVGLF